MRVLFFATILGIVGNSRAFGGPALCFSFTAPKDGDFTLTYTYNTKPPITVGTVHLNKGDQVSSSGTTNLLSSTANDMHYTFQPTPPDLVSVEIAVIGGTPGDFHKELLGDGLYALIGLATVDIPGLLNNTIDLYISVDLSQWVGHATPNVSSVDFVDGRSSLLPGFLVGTSEVTFSSSGGYTTENPFTGTADLLAGTLQCDVCPEPGSLVMIGVGGALSLLVGSSRRQRAAI